MLVVHQDLSAMNDIIVQEIIQDNDLILVDEVFHEQQRLKNLRKVF